MPKRTRQPKKIKTARRHGFLNLMKTPSGRNRIKRRRNKKRISLSSSS